MDTQLAVFAEHFNTLNDRSLELVKSLSEDLLFEKPRQHEHSMAMFSVGEYILRSAAVVEQTAGGITTRLWDDPFEWTLPEELATPARVVEYLNEVETTLAKAFAYFKSDDDLRKQIPAPEKLRTIFDLLVETLARAEHYQGRAFAVYQMVSDGKLPRL